MNRLPYLGSSSLSSFLDATKPNHLYWIYIDELATRWNEAQTTFFSFEDASALRQQLLSDYREGVKGIGNPSYLDFVDNPSTHALIARTLVRLYRLGVAPQPEVYRLRTQLLWEMWAGLEVGKKKVVALEGEVKVARDQSERWKAKLEEPWSWVSPDKKAVEAEMQWRKLLQKKEAELKELGWVARLEREYVEIQSGGGAA